MLLIRSQKNLKHTAACEVVGVCRVMKLLVVLSVIVLVLILHAKMVKQKNQK